MLQSQAYRDFQQSASQYVSPSELEKKRLEERNKKIRDQTKIDSVAALLLISSDGKKFTIPELQEIDSHNPSQNKDFLKKANDVVYQCGKMCQKYTKKTPPNLKIGNREYSGNSLIKNACKSFGNTVGCKLSMPLSPTKDSVVKLKGFSNGLITFGNFVQEEIDYGSASCKEKKNNEKVCQIKWR